MIVSVVGSETLLGRELVERLNDMATGAEVRTLAADEQIATAREDDEDAVLLAPLTREMLAEADLIFCAASPASSRLAYQLASQTGATFIDLTDGLDDLPESRLRSPFTEIRTFQPASGMVHLMAHPAATALVLLLQRLSLAGRIEHCLVHIFEPASERGKAGIEELQQQTAGLLSFRPLDKKVFDAQLAFNLLPQYGEDAPVPLKDVESRIERHLATLMSNWSTSALLPSLRLVQAPVFHGYSFSLWLEMTGILSLEEIATHLKTHLIDLWNVDGEAPANAGAAGQSGISVGRLQLDPNHPGALWLWAVTDNLRLRADEALEVARPYLEGEVD